MADRAPRDVKTMSLRLAPELADRLEAVAAVEGRPVAEIIREAITEHVERRRRDPKFQLLLKGHLARHARLLRMLRED